MHILLVAATAGETAGLRTALGAISNPGGLETATCAGDHITFLHTGVGLVNTAFVLGQYLAHTVPDFSLQVGIAGSYRRSWSLGTAVQVVQETQAELGAASPEGFLDMAALGFPVLSTADVTWYNTLRHPTPPALGLPVAHGISVQTVQGEPAGISQMEHRWAPDVESMEGAAFFYACLRTGVPFAEIRTLSNYVETRDKSRWDIPLALRQLTHTIMALLQQQAFHAAR
ncbi:MAG: futalosine hydrolase [Bacteroidia bacterium]|nr:futalosine hydrolase [Bacteroidia bacterium]